MSKEEPGYWKDTLGWYSYLLYYYTLPVSYHVRKAWRKLWRKK